MSPAGASSGPVTSTATASPIWSGRTTVTWEVVVLVHGRPAREQSPRLEQAGVCADVAGWSVVGAGDFNGDGKPDLVWQNDGTWDVVVWYMGGPQGNSRLGRNRLASTDVAGWSVVGARDFNGDSKPDLVWQNDGTWECRGLVHGRPAREQFPRLEQAGVHGCRRLEGDRPLMLERDLRASWTDRTDETIGPMKGLWVNGSGVMRPRAAVAHRSRDEAQRRCRPSQRTARMILLRGARQPHGGRTSASDAMVRGARSASLTEWRCRLPLPRASAALIAVSPMARDSRHRRALERTAR